MKKVMVFLKVLIFVSVLLCGYELIFAICKQDKEMWQNFSVLAISIIALTISIKTYESIS